MAPCTKLGKGIPICHQSKEIIYNVFLHEDEANKKNPSSIETTFQLVAKKTGISLRSVQKIISEKRKYPDGVPEVPRAPRKCRKALSDVDKQVIQRIIRYYHATEQQFPTVKKIHEILKQEINYSAGITTLRKHIVQLGFKWKKTDDKKRLLIEKKQTGQKNWTATNRKEEDQNKWTAINRKEEDQNNWTIINRKEEDQNKWIANNKKEEEDQSKIKKTMGTMAMEVSDPASLSYCHTYTPPPLPPTPVQLPHPSSEMNIC